MTHYAITLHITSLFEAWFFFWSTINRSRHNVSSAVSLKSTSCVRVQYWLCCREAREARVTTLTHCKQTGPSLKCFIYSVVSLSNYNSSLQALSLPHTHRLSHCDVEGAVVLKVGQSEHLTSFPDTLLGLFHKSLLIGVHLKKKSGGGKAFDGQECRRKGRSEEPERTG